MSVSAEHTASKAGKDTAAQKAARYLQDRYVLLFLSVNLFLTLVVILSVIFRLHGSSNSGGIIVQYRPSLGIGAFEKGSSVSIYAFVVFALLVMTLHTALSARAYAIRRHLALTVLALGTLLLAIATIVANALLALD